MTKAYSVLKIKSIKEDGEARTITGIASTPTPDRDSDIIEPSGAKFALPIPLLWQHNHNQPIGEVTAAVVTDAGIEITATIAKIDEEGTLKNRIDEAWQSIKSGLVKCLSIGCRALDFDYLDDGSYGLHIKTWEWFELSAVTVPANPDAMITSVKQIKQAFKSAEAPAPPNIEPPRPSKPEPQATVEPPVAEPVIERIITLVDPNAGSIPLLPLSGDNL